MKNQSQIPALICAQSPIQRPASSSRIIPATFQLVLVFVAAALLVGCAGGPPSPPPPEDPAQAKADAQAQEDFARSLPKPPER